MLKRPILMFGLIVATAALAACGWTADRPAEVDLLSLLPGAERRAGGDVTSAIRADVFVAQGDGRMALVLEAPARTTWSIRLPLHAQLRTAVAGSARLRIGVSNGRTYAHVAQLDASAGWRPVTIDLRDWSEAKWSLFYHPLRVEWRLIFNADATPGGTTIALDRPHLTTS
jgi:hypothetical protein